MRQFTARHIPHRQALTTHPCIKANALKGGLRQAGHFFGRTKVRPYKQDAPKHQQNINENHTNTNVGTHLGASENKRNTPQQQPNINGNHANANVGTHLGASEKQPIKKANDTSPKRPPFPPTLQKGADYPAIRCKSHCNQHLFTR